MLEISVLKTSSREILAKKISGYVLDEIMEDYDIDELGKIQSNIRTSKYSEKITVKVIKNVINSTLYGDSEKLEISDEVSSLISENIQSKDTEKIEKNLSEKLQIIQKTLENEVLNCFGDYYAEFLNIYNILTGLWFRVINIAIVILCAVVLTIMEKQRSINFYSLAILTSMIVNVVSVLIIKIMFGYIDQKFAGGWLSDINVDGFIALILFELVLYIILKVVSNKNIKISDEKMQNKV